MPPIAQPWHVVTPIREELKRDDFALSIFAANLYDVLMDRGFDIYRKPEQFFTQTYSTRNVQELAKQVILRLAGRTDRAVHQLELRYGGGKTHTLISLYHLTRDPANLPNVQAVDEIVTRAGTRPPRARVACVPFDYLDPDLGMEIPDPSGGVRRLRMPWSVLAWQVAGEDGMRAIGSPAGGEREEPPFTNVLEDLFALPAREGLGTLVLMDEVLMWARTKIGAEPIWSARVEAFFQALTQAVTRVPRTCLVASLLASDLSRMDEQGRLIAQRLSTLLRREGEGGVDPVSRDDVATILRRRFFEPQAISDPTAFRSNVAAAVGGIGALDEHTQRNRKAEEDRYLASFPFHPDLTNVLYERWSQLPNFQRARGVLRLFYQALRGAERWDASPIVGPNVFLSAPDVPNLSAAASELAEAATRQTAEGQPIEWTAILTGELEKARAAQREIPDLRGREVEQAVMATFLHSQPVASTARAQTREIMALIGHGAPDRIRLEEALARWAGTSWFLDETALQEAELAGGGRRLPRTWRLGFEPNIRQMQSAARIQVNGALVDGRLMDEIGKLRSLTEGAGQAGARVHTLPQSPRDVEDDGAFHYAVLGLRAASEPNRPGAEARRFLEETTGPDRPRVYRNAVVLAAPSREALDVARDRVRDVIAWEQVRAEMKLQNPDFEAAHPIRAGILNTSLRDAARDVPEAIRAAYNIAVTRDVKGDIQAYRIAADGGALFAAITQDRNVRIQTTAISADALLPGGVYDLWRPGEHSLRAADLVDEFARNPRLPKMLRAKAIYETLAHGCAEGTFVFRLERAGEALRTFWRETVPPGVLEDDRLEVVLPEAASIVRLDPALLAPGRLPELWQGEELIFGALCDYFSGTRVAQVKRVLSGHEYEEPMAVPGAPRDVLEAAVCEAVRSRALWLVAGQATLLADEVPAGLLEESTLLLAPPADISVENVLPGALPEAWAGERTTPGSIAQALASRWRHPPPWTLVRQAIENAFRVGMIDFAGTLPATLYEARDLAITLAADRPGPPPVAGGGAAPPGGLPLPHRAEAVLRPYQIQDLADNMAAILAAATEHGAELTFTLDVSVGAAATAEAIEAINLRLAEVSPELRLE